MVFASSDGDGDIVHRLCSALATPAAAVSPTDFHNSVHNAATGYWSIGAHSQAASTALCAYDGSFAAGLLEAACQIAIEKRPVLLVAVDLPYPPPLAPHRPVRHGFAAALVLEPGTGLEISLEGSEPHAAADCAISKATPAAACLPLLAALARPGEALVRLPFAERVAAGPQNREVRPGRDRATGAAPRRDVPARRGARMGRDTITCRAASHRDPANPLRRQGGLAADHRRGICRAGHGGARRVC